MISKPTGLFPDGMTVNWGQGTFSAENLFTPNGATKGAIIKYSDNDDNDNNNNYGSVSDGDLITDYQTVWGEGLDRRERDKIEWTWKRSYVSDYIPVKASYRYVVSGYKTNGTFTYKNGSDVDTTVHLVFAWYNSNKVFIQSDLRGNNYQELKAPLNAAYLRVGFFGSSDTSNDEKSLKIQEVALYSDGIRLQCQVLSGSDIETFTSANVERAYAMLILWYRNRYYHFPFTLSTNPAYAPVVERGKDFITVTLDLPRNLGNGYYYYNYNTGGTHYMKKVGSVNLSEILTNGINYQWKLRLYEKGSIKSSGTGYIPDECIGYGTIGGIEKVKGSKSLTGNESPTGMNFTIFPHTNIYDYVAGNLSVDGNSSGIPGKGYDNSTHYYDNANISDALYEIYRCIDSNIKYWIRTNGRNLLIDKYRFYPYKYDHDGDEVGDDNRLYYSGANSCFDEYGTPYHGYAIIRSDSFGTQWSTLVEAQNSEDIFTHSTYRLMTNYVDSNWGYFELYDTPSLAVTDNNGIDISNTFESSPATLPYGMISISAVYSQNQGVNPEYYSYKIYSREAETNDEFILDYASDVYYNRNIKIEYDRILGKREYKVYLSVMDATQRTIDKTIYYKTEKWDVVSGIIADACYYSQHNSIVVDWSEFNSISPASINIDEFDYVEASCSNDIVAIKRYGDENYSGANALYLHSGQSLEYTKTDFGYELSFSNPKLTVEFYGTNLTNGEILDMGCTDGRRIRILYETNNNAFRIYQNMISEEKETYIPLSDIATAGNVTEILSGNSEPTGQHPAILWIDEIKWNDTYKWYEHNSISNKWKFEIDNSTISITYPDGYNSYGSSTSYNGTSNPATSSYLTLNGDIVYDSLIIESGEEKVINCNFNGNVNGTNVDINLENLIGWRVFKKLGDNNKLYEVANISSTDSCIIEDFAIGDNCKIKYYIYPIITKTVNNSTFTVSCTPLVTNEIMLQEGVDKVFGLKQIDDRVYEVVDGEVWRLYLNLEDTGFTYNTDKHFYDTFNRYNQETAGNRQYITKSVNGMLGYIDCAERDTGMIDTYDMLVSWNEFTGSPNLKCLIDARGLVLPGNFETNPTVEYDNTLSSYATARFNWRQIADLDVIKIYAKLLPYNPTKGIFIMSSDDYLLHATEIDDKTNILYTSAE